MPTFQDLRLLPSLVATLAEQGLTKPTEVQSRSVSPLLEGRPVVAVSATGSGKTLAYVLPLLHTLKGLETGGDPVRKPSRPRGLVLVPGRELGEQVAKVFKGLTHTTRLRVRSALGGSRKQVARQSVAGIFEILVATPGRLEQLIDSGELRLDDVRTLVFDEADQIVDSGFLPVAERILGACPRSVQLALFSATLSPTLDVVVRDLFTVPPLHLRTRGSRKLVPTLRTQDRIVDRGRRFDELHDILRDRDGIGTLLFANTREQVDRIASWLERERIAHVLYRGQMDRRERRANLARFRDGEVDVLVATDLGARGLDIERVERVVNVHLPRDVDNYLHRVGRTARAGRSGLVINLVTHRDRPMLAKVAKRERSS